MKYYNSIFLLLIVPLFLAGTIKQKSKPKFAKTIRTVSNVNDNLKGSNLSTQDVRFTFTGYVSLFGDSPECPVGSGGTVTLNGMLKGDENVAADDDVYYEGTL